MSDLLDMAVEAHGGIDRWDRARSLTVDAQISGSLFELKGQPDIFKQVEVEISCTDPYTVYRSLGGAKERHGSFEPGRVAIFHGEELQEELINPRAALHALSLAEPWQELHALYFGGYAIWHYLAAPFVFTRQGFQAEEIAPWNEGDEIWRRLEVTFPKSVPSNCPTQTYHFDQNGLLRRMDYHVEILNVEIPVAHYCDDHRSVDGIIVPHRRRAVPRRNDGTADFGALYVGIDLQNVVIQTAFSL